MKSEADIYARQGFGGTVGMGKSPAILIVDFVQGFADPDRFGGGNIAGAITRTKILLNVARSLALPIVHTRVVFADDGSDGNILTLKIPSLLAFTEDAVISQIVPELTPQPSELVIRKQLPSAFAGSSLAAWLALRKVDTLIIAGCTTSGCVRASVVDALGAGMRVLVADDCVGDRYLDAHHANLFDMKQKYADVLTSDRIAAELRALHDEMGAK